MLLSREEFKKQVFSRDKHVCVVPGCGKPAVDAHHILERKLFPDSGYYISNGASVCSECHILCEKCVISVEQIREYCKIKTKILPPGFDSEAIYDKWGKIILDGEYEMKKVDYDKVFKYPSTSYSSLTPGRDPNDKVLNAAEYLEGKEVVISVKLDGENASLYHDWYHARSLDSRHHPSRDWIKSFWSKIRHDIPEGWRVCGENMYAQHSIAYDNLESYFYGFSIWNDNNVALSWDDTLEWFNLLGIVPVPVLYRGPYSDAVVQAVWETLDLTKDEGIVIRIAGEIPYDQFSTSLCKLVRKFHVQTDSHWMAKEVVPNKLRNI